MLTLNEIRTSLKSNGFNGKVNITTDNVSIPIRGVQTLGSNQSVWVLPLSGEWYQIQETDTITIQT